MKRFFVNESLKSICIDDGFISESRLMSAKEVFLHFVRRGGPFLDFEVSMEASDILFRKNPIDITYEIQLGSKVSQLKPHLNGKTLGHSEIKVILECGYLLDSNTWFPVSGDSIEEFQSVYSRTSELKLETNSAFRINSNSNGRFKIKSSKNLLEVFEEQEHEKEDEKSCLFLKSLYDYQERGVSWLKFCVTNKIGTILGDDMGLGKTAQVISLIAWLLENKLTKKILIVVPSTLLENWRREFHFFAPSIVPCIHYGHLRIGLHTEFEEYEVVVTSYSLVINDFTLLDKIHWDLTVLDEASLIKNPESERTKKIKALNSEVRIAMTGTPVENSLIDLWSIVDFTNPGYLQSLDEFKSLYVANTVTETLERDLVVLREFIKPILLRRMKVDLLDSLPDKIDIPQALLMSDYERRRYDQIRDEIINNSSSNQEACFKLINDLRQFTTHPILIEPENEKSSRFTKLMNLSVKFRRTVEILEDIKDRGEKVLIFTGFIGMVDHLTEYISEKFNTCVYSIDGRVETSERQVNIDKFSAENGFAVMVLNPTTAAMGLNITAANNVIHYTRQWNPAIEIQASARAYRNGQKLGVNIFYLYYSNTIEEIMNRRLIEKEALADEVIVVKDHEDYELSEILEALKDNI